MNCFVSLETGIWMERKNKKSVVLEKNYFKETTFRIEANCALKILFV